MTSSLPIEQIALKIAAGIVPSPEGRVALTTQATSHYQNGKGLLRSFLHAGVPLEDLKKAVYRICGYEPVRLTADMVDSDLISALDIQTARKVKAVPVTFRDGRLVIAAVDPTDTNVIDAALRWDKNGQGTTFVIADEFQIEGVLSWAESQADFLKMEEPSTEEDLSEWAARTDDDDDEVVGKYALIAKQLVEQAVVSGASDISLAPDGDRLHVQYRIDRVLHDRPGHPMSMAQGIVNRFKVRARLDLGNQNRLPQDGRFSATVAGRKIDIRVATMPTVWGVEACSLRILDSNRIALELPKLIHRQAYAGLSKAIEKPYGMVLVTGPTNNGKTTTLMASIRHIADGTRKIITAEDPAEYKMKLKGVIQSEVNTRTGYTFEKALRADLRMDPDVIVVGEIRDKNTAQVACEAALTGHLVLASLHVDVACGAATRLCEMDVEPFLVASTLHGVLAQRLVRRLCPACRLPLEDTAEIIAPLGWPESIEEPLVIFGANPEGCGECGYIGYRGQAAVTEYLNVTEQIRKAIIDRLDTEQITKIARSEGMMTLREDGLAAVAEGITTVDELFRVVI